MRNSNKGYSAPKGSVSATIAAKAHRNQRRAATVSAMHRVARASGLD